MEKSALEYFPPDVLYKSSCTDDHIIQLTCINSYTALVNIYTPAQQVSVIFSWAARACEYLVRGLTFSWKQFSVSKNTFLNQF